MKINATFVFKRGAHLLEWPEVCRRLRGDGAVCLLGSRYTRQGAGSKTFWRVCPSLVSETQPPVHHVSLAALPPAFWSYSIVMGVSGGS